MKELEIGQLWQLKDASKIYNFGHKNDYFIITNKENGFYGVGIFWMSGTGKWFGMRSHKHLTLKEITESSCYISSIESLLNKNDNRRSKRVFKINLCVFGIHKWTCWKDYLYQRDDKIFQAQKRYCLKCRIKDIRK